MSPVFYRSPVKSYPTISHGQGVYLWDTDGKRYLDGSSGALVANIGHGRAEVATAMAEQAARVAFAHTMRFTSQAQEQLGQMIADRLMPAPYYTYLVSGGSEATETAIKLARQYHLERGEPQRTKIMARWASYHGNTLGALAASGYISRRRPYEPLLAHQSFVHFDVPSADAVHNPCTCLDDVQARMEQANPHTIAALFIEVVGGSALSGFIAHPGYLLGLQKLCQRYGILFVIDEVMTGMGRTGRWWAHQEEHLTPDLMTLAKGLAGGYSPVGAVVASHAVWDTVRSGSGSFAHGFTFGGNPVSAAAAVQVLTIMEREGLVENARERGQELAIQLARMSESLSIPLTIRGRGLMQGLVLPSDPERPGSHAARLADDAFSHGLIVYAGSGSGTGVHGDHILVAPPLSVSSEQIQELVAALAESLLRVQNAR